jgi:ACS family allantoate permease-like MFS transporter
VVCFFFLGTAREVPWLSEEEKKIVHARTVESQTGTDREKHAEFDWAQLRECATDPQVYFFFFAQLINAAPNAGVQTFGNLVYNVSSYAAKGESC